jgi:hypothetical protein
VNQIVHHVNSHLSMSDRLAQLVAAALITAAVYYVAVVPLWRIADTLVIQRFYKQRHGMKVRPQARSPEAVTPAAEQSTPAGVS